jgi:hypothetical protein
MSACALTTTWLARAFPAPRTRSPDAIFARVVLPGSLFRHTNPLCVSMHRVHRVCHTYFRMLIHRMTIERPLCVKCVLSAVG